MNTHLEVMVGEEMREVGWAVGWEEGVLVFAVLGFVSDEGEGEKGWVGGRYWEGVRRRLGICDTLAFLFFLFSFFHSTFS